MQPTRSQAFGAAGIGVVSATFVTSFVRLTLETGMDSLALVAWRLMIATLVFTPFIIMRGGIPKIRTLTRREWGFIVIGGVMLAGHFATFISSLEYTSVMGTLIFSSTTPLFAALFGWLFFREHIKQAVLIGIILAMIGTAIFAAGGAGGDPPTRNAPLLGNSLAVVASAFLALYFTIGRQIRAKLDGWTYSWMVYGFAGITGLFLLPLTQTSLLGYSSNAYVWMLVVTLFAQIITHSAWNIALGTLSAPVVSMIMMVIPVSASIAAIFLVGELPSSGWSILGGAIILGGVALANLMKR